MVNRMPLLLPISYEYAIEQNTAVRLLSLGQDCTKFVSNENEDQLPATSRYEVQLIPSPVHTKIRGSTKYIFLRIEIC